MSEALHRTVHESKDDKVIAVARAASAYGRSIYNVLLPEPGSLSDDIIWHEYVRELVAQVCVCEGGGRVGGREGGRESNVRELVAQV